MRVRNVLRLGALLFLLGAEPCWPQAGTSSGADALGSALRTHEVNTWQVFGRVMSLRGEPLADAVVRVSIGSGSAREQILRTNLKGEFRAEYSLEADMYKRLKVRLIARKEGYEEAWETAEFGLTDTSQGIELLLHKPEEEPELLSMTALQDALAPRLRQDAARRLGPDAERKEFVQGLDQLIEHRAPVRAVPLLSSIVGRAPDCVECRLLLSLALINAGSWGGGMRQLEEATKSNATPKPLRPESALISGVLEAWRGDLPRAVGWFKKALEIAPDDPLTLREMGRVLIQQKNWEAADQYLEKALAHGADPDARILRVRVLLELGAIPEATREMDLYMAGRAPKDLPLEARAVYAHVKDRTELAAANQVKSVINQSAQELMKAMPELQGLRAASSQSALDQIVKKTGEGVEAFVKNFPNTVSVEHVHQERLGKDGKVKDALDQRFQYLLLAREERWGLGLEEHRTTAEGHPSALQGFNQGLMLTSGFTSASWVFHPANQPGTSFRYLGRQTLEDKDVHVVAFAQKPETAKMMGRFITDQVSALVLVQGLAWIDPSTFQILRLRTDLLNPLDKVRLQRQTTEIQFKQVAFKEVALALWLPEQVAVTVDWRGRLYRNWHRYSDFRLFKVDAKEEQKRVGVPEAPRAD